MAPRGGFRFSNVTWWSLVALAAVFALGQQQHVVRADDDTNNNITPPDSYIDDLDHCENPFAEEELPISCDPQTWLWNVDELEESNPPLICQSFSADDWRFTVNRNIMPNDWEPCRLWYRMFYNTDNYAGDFVVATVSPTAAPTPVDVGAAQGDDDTGDDDGDGEEACKTNNCLDRQEKAQVNFGPIDLRYAYPRQSVDSSTFSLNRQELYEITQQHLVTVFEAEFGDNVQEVQLVMTSTRFDLDDKAKQVFVTEQLSGVVVFVEPAIVLQRTMDDLAMEAFTDNGLALYLFRLQIATDSSLQTVEDVVLLNSDDGLDLGESTDDAPSGDGGSNTGSSAFEWDTVTVAIVAAVGSAFLMVVVFVVCLFCKRRNKQKSRGKSDGGGATAPQVVHRSSSNISRNSKTSRQSKASTVKAASTTRTSSQKKRPSSQRKSRRSVPPPPPPPPPPQPEAPLPIEDPEEETSVYSYEESNNDDASAAPSFLYSIHEGADDYINEDSEDGGIEVEDRSILSLPKSGSFKQNDAEGKDRDEVEPPKYYAQKSNNLLSNDNSDTASGASNSLLLFGDGNSIGSGSRSKSSSLRSMGSSRKNLVDRVPPGSPSKSTIASQASEDGDILSSSTSEKKERGPFDTNGLAAAKAYSARKKKATLSKWSKSDHKKGSERSESTEARLRHLLETETRRHSLTAIDANGSLHSKGSGSLNSKGSSSLHSAKSQPALLSSRSKIDNNTSSATRKSLLDSGTPKIKNGKGLPQLMFTRKVHNDDSSSEEEVYVEDEESRSRPFTEQESVELDINTSLPESLLTTDTHSDDDNTMKNITLGDITLEDHSYYHDPSASSESRRDSHKIGRFDDGSSLSEVGSGGTMQGNEMLLLDDTLPDDSNDEGDKLLCETAPTAETSDSDGEENSHIVTEDHHSIDNSLEESMCASVNGENIDQNISAIIDASIKTGGLKLDQSNKTYPDDAEGINSVQASQALSALLGDDTVAGGKSEYTKDLSVLLRDNRSVATSTIGDASSGDDPELGRLDRDDDDSEDDHNAPKIMIDTSKYFKAIGADTGRRVDDEDESRYTISPDGSKVFDKFGTLAAF